MDDRLGVFQREVLQAFFRHERRFFLTGGAALVGFHLGHRTTADLDLFTEASVLEDGERALLQVARELGATLERLQTAPEFRRRLLRRADDAVVVDLVLDRAPQLHAEKPIVDGVRLDPPDEILANKLCALLSRSELRDLVDVRALEASGLSLDAALAAARRKDGGLTTGQLCWVLSELRIGDDAVVPGGGSVRELREYLHDLRERLARAAFPG